tara:strand:- start:741 stop:914 length:174 start_codon:yes stop_codon:yes gene_type:complete
MGRPKESKGTTHWRMPKEIANELRMKFPGMSQSQLIRVMYQTSALKIEAKLRAKKRY